MDGQTYAELTDRINLIRNEITPGAITKTEVADTLQAIVDSMILRVTSGALTWVESGAYDASTNLFPDVGTCTGTGDTGEILEGNTVLVGTGGTLGGVLVVTNSILIALVDNPGQVLANWKINQG